LRANEPDVQLMTDEAIAYKYIAETDSLNHETVNDSRDRYARYRNEVTDKLRDDGKPVVETTTMRGVVGKRLTYRTTNHG
jgi:hypothetical protein